MTALSLSALGLAFLVGVASGSIAVGVILLVARARRMIRREETEALAS